MKERDDIMEVCFMSEDITPETLISIDRTNIETKTTTATKRVAIAVRDIPIFFFLKKRNKKETLQPYMLE